MSVSPQRSAEMLVNGEATSVSHTSASAKPEVTKSSPWKKPKQSSSTDSEMSKQIMTQPQVTHSAYVPSQLERHLEFMHFNSEGHMILGCSNLTGRFWIGSLWYYRDPSEAPSVEKALTGVDFDNGLVDGFFLDEKNIIVAGDGGAVEQVKLSFSEEDDPQSSFFYLDRIHSAQEHDDIITGIVLTADKSKLVTASYDKSIVVLEKETLKLLSRVPAAHTDLINTVAADPFNTNSIVTAGNDGKVLTWDVRKTNIEGNVAQSCIYDDLSLKPSCLQFLPSNENYLLLGNQGGEIQLLDMRKPSDCVTKNTQMDKLITKIKFSPHDQKMFGVCSESTPLKIMQLDDKLSAIDVRYEDSRHEDFVRDVVWKPDAASKRLFSCGWDHKVLTHNL